MEKEIEFLKEIIKLCEKYKLEDNETWNLIHSTAKHRIQVLTSEELEIHGVKIPKVKVSTVNKYGCRKAVEVTNDGVLIISDVYKNHYNGWYCEPNRFLIKPTGRKYAKVKWTYYAWNQTGMYYYTAEDEINIPIEKIKPILQKVSNFIKEPREDGEIVKFVVSISEELENLCTR